MSARSVAARETVKHFIAQIELRYITFPFGFNHRERAVKRARRTRVANARTTELEFDPLQSFAPALAKLASSGGAHGRGKSPVHLPLRRNFRLIPPQSDSQSG